ncbi:hypothetical protein Bbelb_114520 [Branchiostoma belcheri]|nr:hypothetical protein Bbelb_114520 [Branchiostoma belcheri]
MYEQAEPVRSPFSGPDSPQPSGPPPQPCPVRQSGSRGRVRHGNGASDKQRPREDQDTSSHTYENAEEAKRYATSADRAYPGGASGRRGVCSFLRARRSCQAASIAVLLGLVAVGLAPLTFSNKQEISQLSTTVDALKRDQDGMSTTVDALKRDLQLDNERNRTAAFSNKQEISQLSTTVDALKRDQDGMSTTVDALKRDQDGMSTTVDALKRDQDGMSTTVDALKRDQDGMSTTVDALKRDQDGMSTTVDALKRDQDGMSTTVDALERDLDNERNRTAALEQRLHEIEKTLLSYTIWRGICYKACNTLKTFSEADEACRVDGGTLAMPRDADTNAFLVSLYKPVMMNDHTSFWFGLHDQRKEGRFEWVDGSALGPYNSWGPQEPNDAGSGEDCAVYSAKLKHKTSVGDTTTVQRLSDHPQ